ncbi:DMT family transporter [Roseovarius spongiae]|uniref:DMT family transporter n=1 Tax=Roseovarius spongiae TaxID=2320272 RepID=A0A3A8BAD5_9RHOB|nr:DMT family transporter [Roseovarius spongiae]RKF16032.1 DMT family transporter [Roseovarius spongiae]
MTRPVVSQSLAPVLLTFLSAIFWGLWWIPMRYLGAQGLSGAQAPILTNLGASIAIGAWLIATRRPVRLNRRALAGAALVGGALTFYSISLGITDVLRAILLFYLAPAWSKVIEWAVLGQRWRHSATLTLLMALMGAFLVLGGDVSLAGVGLGDGVAILSGLCWAVGATFLFTEGRAPAGAVTLATLLFSVLIAAGFMVVVGDALPAAPDPMVLSTGLGLGAVYILPVMFLTLWSAQRLSPALLSFLFTLEILSGVISGAVLLDERFGAAQVAGAALILAAALIEVILALRARPVRPA